MEILKITAEAIGSVAAFGALIMGFINQDRIKSVHIMINSRMDELLELTKKSSIAEGRELQRTGNGSTTDH
jgi:hypothetical protein